MFSQLVVKVKSKRFTIKSRTVDRAAFVSIYEAGKLVILTETRCDAIDNFKVHEMHR
jgi:hypothetical protein